MIRKRIRSYKVGQRDSTKGWYNCLAGVPAFLIGNGPSLEPIDLSILENYFTIGINRAFYKIDPTILMWQDAELYWNHRAEVTRLKAIKYCRDVNDPKGRFYHFKIAGRDFKLPDNPSVLNGFGSTGPLAFQLAWSLGCNPIVLLGYDCCYKNGKTDYYGKNPSHKPHTLANCRKGLVWIKSSGTNRDIINCSENEVFAQKHVLSDVVGGLTLERAYNRASFLARLSADKSK